ncbi:MAG: T9SS type A sorting domain-containing protein [Pseudobacter sp.]|uniref:T9SS type A sorting domain-containing protein n=1 Tax=Pseudobacter sp. TaxID=2045420 RepID=UPI003F7FCCBF
MNLKSFTLSALLILCMQMLVRAQTATKPAGTGTAADPYQIATLNNLYWISQNSNEWTSTKQYIQTANIDASATSGWFPNGSGGFYGFPPIGGFSQTEGNHITGYFYGTYNGNGYLITGLYMNRSPHEVALFGRVWLARISNLTLVNPQILIGNTGGTTQTYWGSAAMIGNGNGTFSNLHVKNGTLTNNGTHCYTGLLFGRVDNLTISNCSADGSIKNTTTSSGQSGLFVGLIEGSTACTITDSWATGTLESNNASYTGGFVGAASTTNGATFSTCWANVNVTATTANVSSTGGFTGLLFGNNMRFINCYARGNVTGAYTNGGFVGFCSGTGTSSAINCYSTGSVGGTRAGGFVGTTGTQTFSNCYWDNQTSTKSAAAGSGTVTGTITGKTTAEMKTQSTYATWDFRGETTNGTGDYWFLLSTANSGYPALVGNIREWTGATNTTWTTATNWKDGIAPVNASIIKFNAAPANYPVITSSIILNVLDLQGLNRTLNMGNNTLTANEVLGATSTQYLQFSNSGKLYLWFDDGTIGNFPIGNSSYNPVTIYNNTGARERFAIGVVDGVYKNGGTSGTTVDEAHVRRTWNIEKQNANAGSGINITFNWNAGEVAGTLTTPALFHYESNKWKQQVQTGSSTATSFTFTGYTGSFSPFAIADAGSGTLPLQWGSFTAVKDQQHVSLKWSTENESSTKDFIIQHSTDQQNWKNTGIVAAAGNSTVTQRYSFIHLNPATGTNYYRILQRDIDENSSFSKISSVNFDGAANSINIYPNPVTSGQLTVQTSNTIIAQIFNSSGIMVLQQQIIAGTRELNLSLPAGMYYFKAGNKSIPFLIR